MQVSSDEINMQQKCCINCKWFEERTCFCRFNPPYVAMQYVDRTAYPTSIFPKISVPSLDWCSNFNNKNTIS